MCIRRDRPALFVWDSDPSRCCGVARQEADRRHANLTHDIERGLRVRQHHCDEVESIVCKVVREEGCALE